MAQGKAEDAGGLTPAKDGNTALWHFGHRTLPIFKCVDYKPNRSPVKRVRFGEEEQGNGADHDFEKIMEAEWTLLRRG